MRTFTGCLAALSLFALGCADSTAPASSTPPLAFIALSAGNARTCAIAADSTAWCWGSDTPVGPSASSDLRPVRAFTGGGFRAVATGMSIWGEPATCVLTSAGMSSCDGQLDVDGDAISTLTAGEPLPGGLALADVSIGHGQVCGRTDAGDGYCWGDFEGGVRGLATISFDTSHATMAPNPIDGGHSWTQLAAGWWHTCGLDRNGAAWCWGADNLGQLGAVAAAVDSSCGLAPLPCSKVPVAVDGGHVFTSLSAGGAHTCGVTTAGDVYCWGSDAEGQLGVGGAADLCAGALHIRCALAPVKVSTNWPVVFVQVSAGESHTCARSDSLQAYCWGDDSYGQLGIGGGRAPTAWPVKTDVRFQVLASGTSHTCGIAVGGAAWCWGDNASGELGNGTVLDANVPVPVAGP